MMVLLGLANSSAEASPIRQFRVTARGARDLRVWSNYLARGVEVWAHTRAPHISGAVKRAMVQALKSADPRSTPWVQYLLWRQGRNPERFNFYHPQLGPVLQQLPPPVAPPTPPINPPAPEIINPPPDPVVPEPSTLLVSVVLLGAALWWRGRQEQPRILALT